MTNFSIEEHAKKYINYLEVIIEDDGTVHYAIPSHQRKLIQLYCDKNNLTEQELYDMIPITASPEHWMCYHGNYIAVWYEGIICSSNITDAQLEVLSRMIDSGIMSNKFTLSVIYYDEKFNIYRSSQEVVVI